MDPKGQDKIIRVWAKAQIPIACDDLLAAQICYCPGIVRRVSLESRDQGQQPSRKTLFLGRCPAWLWRIKLRILITSFRCLTVALRQNIGFHRRALGFSNTTTRQVYWQEYYKRPALDDEPFIRRLSEDGINVVRPWSGLPATIEALKAFVVFNWAYWRNVKRIARMVERDIDDFSEAQHRLVRKFFITGLTSDRAIKRVAKAYIFDRCVLIRDLNIKKPKIIVMRHVGDPLIGILCRNAKLSKGVYSVILNHSASLLRSPENQNHLLVDMLLLKNDSAKETVHSWDEDERPREGCVAVVGDAAIQKMRSVSAKADSSKVTVFLSDAIFWRGLASFHQEDVEALLLSVACLEKKGIAVQFKPKAGSLDSTSSICRPAREFFLARIAAADSFDCIMRSGQCYVIPDLVYGRISSIAVDCASVGKLTGILLPANLNVQCRAIWDEIRERGWYSLMVKCFYDTVLESYESEGSGLGLITSEYEVDNSKALSIDIQRSPTDLFLEIVRKARVGC